MELQQIQSKVHEIRGQKVMLDFDLAALYEVETKRLKESVKRNIERFEGEDFMFELTDSELRILRSQIATSRTQHDSESKNWGGSRYKPMAFTEMGVAMLSSVLRSPTAIQINRDVMRAFVAIRQHLTQSELQGAEIRELRERLKVLEIGAEDTLSAVNDLSEDIRREVDNIYMAIAELSIKPAPKARRPMGYRFNNDEDK